MNLRFNDDKLEEYVKRTGLGSEHLSEQIRARSATDGQSPGSKKGQPGQTAAGEMNKTEARYYRDELWPLMAAEEIIKIRFEEEKFKLGNRLYYTPDFGVVWHPDLAMKKTYIEIKGGFIREKSVIKFKAAASKFPEYSWQLWRWKTGEGWKRLFDL